MSEFKLMDIDDIPDKQDEMTHLRELMDGKIRHDRTAKAISIAEIIPRKENFYIIDEIKELECSIEEIGLLQPIVVRKNLDSNKRSEKYIIVSGERRFTAYKNLFYKYLELMKQYPNNKEYEEKNERFSEINAYVLSDEEVSNEEKIYKDTNDLQRNKNAFAYMCGYKPTRDWFSLKAEDGQLHRDDYINNCLSTEDKVKYEAQELTIMWSEVKTIATHLTYLLNNRIKGLDLKVKTIQNWLASYWLADNETINKVLKPENNGLSIRQFIKLCTKKTANYQKDVLALMDTGVSFEDAFKEITKIDDKPVKEKKNKTVEDELNSYINYVEKFFKEDGSDISLYAKCWNEFKNGDYVVERKIMRRMDKIKELLEEIKDIKS